MSHLLLPERLIEIAQNCVRKHRSESSPNFEDFRQDVLLGILERQPFYNPALGTAECFVISVARQTAKHCIEEHRQHLRQMTTNYRTQLPNLVNEIDADTADEFGLLVKEDDSLMFIQLTVFLTDEEATLLILRLSRWSRKCICRQLCITKAHYAEILNGLKTWAKKLFPFKGSNLHY
ncbi:hypothetical protein FACS189427_03430 [Planctomycetales bacterium]|nr:hypothetical protein FACS189427_03430 [Planctomycetales bacterium]